MICKAFYRLWIKKKSKYAREKKKKERKKEKKIIIDYKSFENSPPKTN